MMAVVALVRLYTSDDRVVSQLLLLVFAPRTRRGCQGRYTFPYCLVTTRPTVRRTGPMVAVSGPRHPDAKEDRDCR